ncbi:dnaJ homolog subfamily C member 24 isoform X1 [Takifugu flavidus]|uniref:dnaJ homolog subfamily C member 24 isoform X1 n=1 Tax=Takifugu flavidus TaxID=433684 RepID=UPI002544C097|nr:dnaJ homolog subfamily C member 24 isoform X1 [Takifugu flavidus]
MGETEHTDLYRVLGATSGDSVQHIKHKYQQLALQYHPDRFRGDTPEEADAALKKFLEIDAAWRILKDQASRRQYDLKLRAQELTQDWPVDRTVGLEDMSWDEGSGSSALTLHLFPLTSAESSCFSRQRCVCTQLPLWRSLQHVGGGDEDGPRGGGGGGGGGGAGRDGGLL